MRIYVDNLHFECIFGIIYLRKGGNMKIYKRENYLRKIRGFYNDDETIKVIVGIRRCGKSYFLKSIIDELKDNGVKEKDIINISLDKRPYKNIKTPEEL